jgi:hypothetical protein
MDDSLVLALRSAATGAETKEDAYLFDAAADLIEQQATRITESESHRNDLADKIVEQKTEIGALKARLTALESERDALLPDAGRLDFLIKQEAGMWTNGFEWCVAQCGFDDPDIFGEGKTPREAIDAALSQQKPGEQ